MIRLNQRSSEPIKVGELQLPNDHPELAWIEYATDFLDTKFTIPGTKIKFGADFILGLLPGVGDVVSLAFSGVLVAVMAKHGASKLLVARMMINVLLDTIVGAIPILGNLFDLFYKANHRNMILMREYYHEGKHTGSVWPLVFAVSITVLMAIGLLTWALVELIAMVWVAIAS